MDRAREICHKWVKILGGGFHPDTRGKDYVYTKSGKRCLTNAQAEEYDRDIEELFSLGGDPYEYAIEALESITDS